MYKIKKEIPVENIIDWMFRTSKDKLAELHRTAPTGEEMIDVISNLLEQTQDLSYTEENDLGYGLD